MRKTTITIVIEEDDTTPIVPTMPPWTTPYPAYRPQSPTWPLPYVGDVPNAYPFITNI